MGTAIVLLVLIVIVIFSLRGYLKKTRYGCCGSGGGEQRVKPDDRNPAHFPYEYEVGVDNMKCQNCAIRVENAFHERDGFLAKVHLKERKRIFIPRSRCRRKNSGTLYRRAAMPCVL